MAASETPQRIEPARLGSRLQRGGRPTGSKVLHSTASGPLPNLGGPASTSKDR